jgi:hypothetical protein
VYLIRRISYSDIEVSDYIEVSGWSGLELLSRRVVAYASTSAQAQKTDYADDMIKAIVSENLGSDATDSARDLSAYITIAPDLGAGVSLTRGFSYRNVLTTCQEIANASGQAGTPVYFDVVPTLGSSTLFDFRTYTGQPGADHGGDSDNPVFFGLAWGNLAQPYLAEDYTDEQNAVYGAGRGTKDDRYVSEQEDTARQGLSIWARREGVCQATDQTTQAGVQAKAKAQLQKKRPQMRFSGTLLDTAQSPYGPAWRWGDWVVAEYRGQTFDCLVRAISISVNEGVETINARMELEDYV